jgi:hypothetical protein
MQSVFISSQGSAVSQESTENNAIGKVLLGRRRGAGPGLLFSSGYPGTVAHWNKLQLEGTNLSRAGPVG